MTLKPYVQYRKVQNHTKLHRNSFTEKTENFIHTQLKKILHGWWDENPFK